MKFKQITQHFLFRGKQQTAYYSKPSGYTIDEYLELDAAKVKAFGSIGTSTIGDPL